MNAAARLLNQGALSRGWVMSVFFSRSQLSMAILILGVLFSSLSLIYVTNTTRSLHAGIQQALSDRDKLHVQWGQLVLEKTTRVTQSRVENIATNQLGMVIPDQKSVVVVRE